MDGKMYREGECSPKGYMLRKNFVTILEFNNGEMNVHQETQTLFEGTARPTYDVKGDYLITSMGLGNNSYYRSKITNFVLTPESFMLETIVASRYDEIRDWYLKINFEEAKTLLKNNADFKKLHQLK